MQKKLFSYAFMGVCTIGVSGLCSCVDNAYDLNKEIDKTITVGGDLTLPGSSTEEMLLKNILDLDDDSAVKAGENGDYSIVQTGNPSTSEVNVKGVNIQTNGGFKGYDEQLSFSSGISVKIADAHMPIEITEEGINEEIVDLKSATIKNSNSSLILSVTPTASNNTGETFTIKEGFKIKFPDYMVIEDASGFCTVNNNNELTFDSNQNFNNEGILKIDFITKEIKFADYLDADFNFERHTITLGGNIILDGEISSTNANGNYTFSASVDCTNINIESANAKVNPEINIEIDPIEVNNLPDFLTEEDVVFDATDPRIFLTISNESPLDADMEFELVSEKNGSECGKAKITGVTIPGNVKNHVICIHQNRGMEIPNVDNVYCENLSDIIKNIPDLIKVENINTKVRDEYYDITLEKTFNIINTYEINTPLMFNGNTKINYTETLDGLSEDLEDAEFNQLEVSMTATNKIPMSLILSAEAIDKYGNVMENVTIEVDGNVEASNGTEATEKELQFVIKTTDGNRIKNLDGLKIKITGTATEATSQVCLNENQSLKLDNVKMKLTGGITMDLN